MVAIYWQQCTCCIPLLYTVFSRIFVCAYWEKKKNGVNTGWLNMNEKISLTARLENCILLKVETLNLSWPLLLLISWETVLQVGLRLGRQPLLQLLNITHWGTFDETHKNKVSLFHVYLFANVRIFTNKRADLSSNDLNILDPSLYGYYKHIPAYLYNLI